MSLSKKIAPSVKDPEMQRIINHLYQDINELVDALAQAQKGDPVEASGRAADLKVVQDGENSYHLAVRTPEGWVSTAVNSLSLTE